MKKIVKSFTFWGAILSILIILMHQLGYDSKSITLIGFNPILDALTRYDTTLNFMQSGYQVPCRNLIVGSTFSIYWYIGSLITFLFYGFILDLILFCLNKFSQSNTQ